MTKRLDGDGVDRLKSKDGVTVTLCVVDPLPFGPQTSMVIGSPTQMVQAFGPMQWPVLSRVPGPRALPNPLMTILLSDQLVKKIPMAFPWYPACQFHPVWVRLSVMAM